MREGNEGALNVDSVSLREKIVEGEDVVVDHECGAEECEVSVLERG